MDALAWIGLVVACGAAATSLVARDPRLRAAAMLLALVLAPILVAGDVWDTERFVDLRDSPSRVAALLAAAAVGVGATAAAILRWPAALPLLLIGVLAFRIPVELGGETSNLLLPLYLVVAGGAVAALVGALCGEVAARARRPAADGPVARGIAVATSLLPWLLAAFLALYALQSAYSSDLSKATETAAFFLVPFAAMFALLVGVRWTRPLLGVLLIVVVAEALVFVGIGVWQAAARELFWNPTVIAGNEVHTYFRVNSVFWDPNVLGRYLTLAILAAAAYMVWTPRSGRALAAALACVALIVGLTLAYSQSSVVALIAGLIVVIAPRWGPRWSLAAGAAAAAAAIALVLLSGVEPTSERSLDVRSSGRVTLLRGGVELAGDRPAYGYGSGSFQEEFSERYLDVDEPEGGAVSHSEPVTIAAEQGAVGLVVYAAMVVAGLAALLGTAPGLPAARTALVACFVAMIVHSLAYAGFLTDPATWALLGVGLALARAPESTPAASSASRPGAAGSPPARVPARPSPSPGRAG
jgi:putative inorganic carbon (hco3(-)) transporter